MGPSVLYVTEKDPLPFEISLAIAYKDTFSIGNWPVVDIAAESRAHREFVKDCPDADPDPFYKALTSSLGDQSAREELAEVQLNWGAEITLFESLSFRNGFLFDWAGQRYEWHLGTGLRLFNHLQFDFAFIYAPEGMWEGWLSSVDPDNSGATGARHGQRQMSFTLFNIGCWSRKDFTPLNLAKKPGFIAK